MDFIQLTSLLRCFFLENHGYNFTTYYYVNRPNQFWFAVNDNNVLCDLALSEAAQQIRNEFEDYRFTICFLGSTGIENIKEKNIFHNNSVVHIS